MASLKDMYQAQVVSSKRVTINSQGTDDETILYKFFRGLELVGKFNPAGPISGIAFFSESARELKNFPIAAIRKTPVGNVGTQNSRFCYVYSEKDNQVICEKPRAVHVEEVVNRQRANAVANGIIKA